MAALTAITPTRTGTDSAGNPVAASDTISSAQLGANGALLEIINGGAAADDMTISDDGLTPAGTPGGTYPASVAIGASTVFRIHPRQVDPGDGLVTITHSVIASVTYKLYLLG